MQPIWNMKFVFYVIALAYCLLSASQSVLANDITEPLLEGTCDSGTCSVDGNIGNTVLFEDATTKIWNFTLGSGEMTSMHRHDCGYHFLATTSAELEVWGESGKRLMDINIKAGDILGFSIDGDSLVQTASENPVRIPRTHAAKNVGLTTFNEILFESKLNCV